MIRFISKTNLLR